ncbi:MAG: hypothetical protein K2Z81_14725, partial [Cyanobacteria bacterium]|nr:hypothetical protein [Cyanobacteriota bacterium]
MSRKNIEELFGHNHMDVRNPVLEAMGLKTQKLPTAGFDHTSGPDSGVASTGAPPAPKLSREERIERNRKTFGTEYSDDLGRRQELLKQIDELPADLKTMFGDEVFAGDLPTSIHAVEQCMRACERYKAFAQSDPVTARKLHDLPFHIRKAIVDPILGRTREAPDKLIKQNVDLADNYAKTAEAHPDLIATLFSLDPKVLQMFDKFFEKGPPDAATVSSLRGVADCLHQVSPDSRTNIKELLSEMHPDCVRLIGDAAAAGKLTGADLEKLLGNHAAKKALTGLQEESLAILQTASKDGRLTADRILSLAETRNGLDTVIAIEKELKQGTLKRTPDCLKELYSLDNAHFEAFAPLVRNSSLSEADLKPLLVLATSPNPQVRQAAAELARIGKITEPVSQKMIEMVQSGDPAKIKAVVDLTRCRISDPDVMAKILALPPDVQSAIAQAKTAANDSRTGKNYTDAEFARLVMLDAPPALLDAVRKVIGSTDDRIVLIDRLESLAEMKAKYIDSGLLPPEAVVKMVTSPHASHGSIQKILDSQLGKGQGERLSQDKLKQLVDLATNDEISTNTLELLSRLHTKNAIDSATLGRLLDLPPADRKNVDLLLSNPDEAFEVLGKKGPEHAKSSVGRIVDADMKTLVEGLTATGADRKKIETAANKIRENLTRIIEELWPSVKFDFQGVDRKTLSDDMKNIYDFAEAMSKGDYDKAFLIANKLPAGADIRVSDTDKGPEADKRDSHEFKVERHNVTLADLQNPSKLMDLIDRMYTADAKREVTGSESKKARMVVPIVEIESGIRVSLFDPTRVIDANGNTVRPTTPAEHALVLSLQSTPAGRALRARMAMIAFEENLVHSHQGKSGGVSKITQEFADSPEFKRLEKYWREKAPDIADDMIDLALREIDVAASLIQSGTSPQAVEKILGNLHLKGEREFFYDFLKNRSKKVDGDGTKPAKPPGDAPKPPKGDAPKPSGDSNRPAADAIKPGDTTKAGPPSPKAREQSNNFVTKHEVNEPLHDGFTNAGTGRPISADGSFSGPRAATIVDRSKDPVLRRTMDDAKEYMKDFSHLPPEQQVKKLAEFVQQKMTAAVEGVDPAIRQSTLDAMYSTLMSDNAGKGLLLGHFIKNGCGTCTQQAMLLKVLVDQMVPGAQVSLVRGNGTGGGDVINHMWVQVKFADGRTQIFDPRQGKYGIEVGTPAAASYKSGSDMPAKARRGGAGGDSLTPG